MIRSATYDFGLQRGNYGALSPIKIALKDSQGLPASLPEGTIVTFRVYNKVIKITKSSVDGSLSVVRSTDLTDPTNLTYVEWLPTEEEVKAIPRGRIATYTLDIQFPDKSGVRPLEGYMIGLGS